MIDDGLYREITGLAQSLRWLAEPVTLFSEYAVFLVAPAILAIGWWALRRGADALARAAWVPCAILLAFAVNSALKIAVAEPRPCRALPGVRILVPCDAPTDYAFPSNHTVIVAAFATAVFLVNRRWGGWAAIFATLMAASRVYIGAHYPHDVVAGAVVGVAVGAAGIFLHRHMVTLCEHALTAFDRARRAKSRKRAG